MHCPSDPVDATWGGRGKGEGEEQPQFAIFKPSERSLNNADLTTTRLPVSVGRYRLNLSMAPGAVCRESCAVWKRITRMTDSRPHAWCAAGGGGSHIEVLRSQSRRGTGSVVLCVLASATLYGYWKIASFLLLHYGWLQFVESVTVSIQRSYFLQPA